MTASPALPLPPIPAGSPAPAQMHGALALDFPLPSGLPAVPQAPPLTLVVAAAEPPDGVLPEVVATGAPGAEGRPAPISLPAARDWAGRFVQAVVEVIAGDRPLQQLVRWTDERVYADLSRRVRVLGLTTTAATRHRVERSQLRSVHVFQPHPEAAEVAAHVRHGPRSRAVAARLEAVRGRWTCTALQLG
jgi:hypothetical protein